MRKYLVKISLVIEADDSEEAISYIREVLEPVGETIVDTLTDEGGETTVIDDPVEWPPDDGW